MLKLPLKFTIQKELPTYRFVIVTGSQEFVLLRKKLTNLHGAMVYISVYVVLIYAYLFMACSHILKFPILY